MCWRIFERFLNILQNPVKNIRDSTQYGSSPSNLGGLEAKSSRDKVV